MRLLARIIAVGLVTFGLTACTTAFSVFKTDDKTRFYMKFWPVPKTVGGYPEMSDDRIQKRASFGVAFQGGGNRAAPAALGQIRMLHTLGWIDQVRYISAISGGSWAAIPYTYLRQNHSEEAFLGTYYTPDKLVSQLVAAEEEGEDHTAFQAGSLLHSVSKSTITKRYIAALESGRFDESYAEALAQIYFDPLRLGRKSDGGAERYFTWREQDMRDLVARNAEISRDDVIYVERKRPYLIVGGTFLKRRLSPGSNGKFRMEMTPLYSGVPRDITWSYPNGEAMKMAGGFVESAGYDLVTDKVKPIEGCEGQTCLKLRKPVIGAHSDKERLRFSLANMAAVSGAAPQQIIISIPGLNALFSNMGFPEHFVPVDQRQPAVHALQALGQRPHEKEWAHGDGGHEDNLGLAPLLQRRVKNIITFANSRKPYDGGAYKECVAAIGKLEQALSINPIAKFEPVKPCEKIFGDDFASFLVKTNSHFHNVSLELITSRDRSMEHPRLRGFYDLLEVARELQAQDWLSCRRYRGFEPQVYKDTAEPVAGSRRTYSTYRPTICLVWLGQDEEWFKAIGAAAQTGDFSDTQLEKLRNSLDVNAAWLPKGGSQFGSLSQGFPHIGTFFDQPGRVIKVERPRALALANYTSWVLGEHSDKIAEAFHKNGLRLTPLGD